jgi:septation ring formation regulator EzrA
MEELVKELESSGLNLEQIKQILTIICKWTNKNHPVMGAVVETMLLKNQLIQYPMQNERTL